MIRDTSYQTISVPFPADTSTENFKGEFSLTPEKLIKYHKDNLLMFEEGILQSNERVRIINYLLL